MTIRGAERNADSLFLKAEQCEKGGDLRAAFSSLLTAARLGHAMSQVSLGNFYADGKGVRRNRRSAAHWYRKAYENGYRDGALNLAIDRRNEGNLRSAVTWFKNALALNSGDACMELAKIYKSRRGGKKKAIGYLKRALRMSSDDITEDAKAQAKSLLKELAR